jgi:ATP-dependent DNA helicase RecG
VIVGITGRMTAPPAIALNTNIAEVPGVGSRRAAAFRRLGVRSAADLLRHLPARYEHELPEQSIADAGAAIGPQHGAEASIAVRGEVTTTRTTRNRASRFEVTLQDDSGTALVVWFNSPWMRGKVHPGMTIRVWGRGKRYGDVLQVVNPKWQALDAAEDVAPRPERLHPIYPASEDLPPSAIEHAVDAALDSLLDQLPDHLHPAYREKRALPTLADSYRLLHRPRSDDDVAAARRRLAFDELLLLQLGVMLKRHYRRETQKAVALTHNDAIRRHIMDRFPFPLTESQEQVIGEIVGDLTTSRPMNRLLQGDVGAGKTVVALYAMLVAVASRHQAAMMAPTELLAEQHYASICGMLEGSNVSIELLTGSVAAAARREILDRLESGDLDLVVGTHALLTEHVSFRSPALAVIDEQHRFGVHQRATLRGKSGDTTTVPHILVMTATPIPRTLSLTVFGDLDISTIRGLPPGRQPVITKHVPSSQAAEVYEYLAGRLDAGDQAYIVVPAIDESDAGLASIETHVRMLADGPLRGRRLGAVHGRLTREERDEVMGRFRAGEIDALVATTVIEVGVDVPNATIMVIEHADRFGLAQLHQLRGRVGRGGRQSLCVLVADPATEDAEARLAAIVGTDDGFEIAEKDLEIRGPGELFGARQSGLAPFRVARIPRDLELLRLARRDAEAWIRENPTLAGERDALLRRRLLKAHGEALGLGDVA